MDLGLETSFSKFPAWIVQEGESFYLLHGKNGYLLVSSLCPHRGGEIKNRGTMFECPKHGWRFEQSEGVCINGPRARMYAFPVTVHQGRLIAEVPKPNGTTRLRWDEAMASLAAKSSGESPG